MSRRLEDSRANTFSQFGEDGMIAAVFERMPPRTRVCAEFGAWDGFHLSNTALLFSRAKWRAFLIEGDTGRFTDLTRNTSEFDCVCINEWVGWEGDRSVESILRTHGLDEQPDLLSIDIDGDDYYVLESLDRLRPQLILCEYNPTLPPDLDLYAPKGTSFGCSASALIRVARSKGYRLIGLTDTNCFFVPEESFALFSDLETRPEELLSRRYLTYVATGYSGQYVFVNAGPYGLTSPFPGVMLGADSGVVDPEAARLVAMGRGRARVTMLSWPWWRSRIRQAALRIRD